MKPKIKKNYRIAAVLIMGMLMVHSNVASGNEEPFQLGVITVTSPGIEQNIEDVQATVEIIQSQQLETLSGRSLSQALQQATGIVVKDSGSNSDLSLRGFEGGQTLILVDGMRRTGKYGSTDLNGIQLEDVERIEIVRGPMSALYGSDAMAGIVNIITRKASAKKAFTAKTICGMAQNRDRETLIFRANGNLGQVGNSYHRISTEIKKRDRYRMEEDQPYTSLGDEERYFISYNGRYEMDTQHYFGWYGEYARQDDEGISSSSVMGYPDTYEKEERVQLTGKYHNNTELGIFDLTLGYGNADTESDRTGGAEKTDYDQYEMNGVWNLYTGNNAHNLSIGAGARKEQIELTILSDSPERDISHLFIQDQWEIVKDITLMGGARYDHYSDFGDTLNPKISLSWTPGDFFARAAYGTAFQAPGFIDMYGYFERSAGNRSHIIRGNPDLEPEKSRTAEAALGFRSNKFSIEGVYHFSKLKNLIASHSVSITTDPVSHAQTIENEYENINKARISGIELSMTAKPTQFWKLSASGEYLDKKDDETDERLINHARKTLKLGSSLFLGDFEFHTYYRGFFDYYAEDPNMPRGSAPIDSNFELVDIKLNYQLSPRHEIAFGIDNLLDKESPSNYTRGGSPLDPGERYYYLSYTARF